MIVSYINLTLTDEHARCTFVGHDAAGKPRRPVIDLDASDLAALVEIAKQFRQRQRSRAANFTARANRITESGVTE